MVSMLLVLLVVSGAVAAPVEPPANPLLEGLDSFLAAFEGFALPGDPLVEVTTATDPPEVIDSPPPELEEAIIVPEEALCLGCVEEIEADSTHLRRIAQTAAALLEEQLNTTEVTAVTQVYWAAEQVVNGIKYFLTLELSPTNCSRPRDEGDECFADAAAEGLLYKVEILEQLHPHNSTELLLYIEVPPEEVADLPGLFTGPEPPPPPPPPPPPASEEPGVAGIEADLAALIGDMETVTLLSPAPGPLADGTSEGTTR